MRKETGIAIGVMVAAVVSISAGLMMSSSEKKETEQMVELEVPVAAEPVMEDELPGRPVPDYSADFEEPEEVTRIIIANPDGDEITELLSEKVIVNDKVVDQK